MFNNNDRYAALDVLEEFFGLPVNNNNYWWVQNPVRAASEIDKMHEHTNAEMLVDGGNLIWVETITDNYNYNYLISINVLPGFPFKMPIALVLEPKITSHDKHVNRDGSLCLMHPDDYKSSMSILEIRNMSCAWCFAHTTYKVTGEWPAAEHEH